MKKLLVVGLLVCSGCAAKFDPKVDPDVAQIVEAVNGTRADLVKTADAINAILILLEQKHPGFQKKWGLKFQEMGKQNEGKS